MHSLPLFSHRSAACSQTRRALSFAPLFLMPAMHIVVRRAPRSTQLGVYGVLMGAYSCLTLGMYMSADT